MPDEFGEVTRYFEKLADSLVSPAALRRLQREGIKASTDAARRVGRAHRFRNWHGSRLDAREGNDEAELTGPWRLFDQGRRSRGEITPRRAQAVRTPDGPRAGSSFGPSSGLDVYRDASRDAQRLAPEAMHEAFQDEIRRAMS